ncbi:MAG: glycoside hydrolase family 57 protein [Candidatus Omnitrophica bacterium]|jgi:alpha-amylase/alpha-mannosidase (GH57 family)|nr:glycoside hydrolase family 57 protein [Candidatus Omnitrophota bacterium]
MLYLAFIFHMHQPYYKDLLTQETNMPWVRLHGVKDYADMILMLEKFPRIHQTFNFVPSLLEQIDDYTNRTIKDKFLELSYKAVPELTREERDFIRDNFFMINPEKVIFCFPRYYELFYKRKQGHQFNDQETLDLQVWFNLAWIDPYYRQNLPQLSRLVAKARDFTEEDKHICLDTQTHILEEIIPVCRKFQATGQIEITANPYYHPILPLLYNTNVAKEANIKTILPKPAFAYPQDAQTQIDSAVALYKNKFGASPVGMWPSEEAVSEHILPFIMNAGIKWIVTDESMLFRSLRAKKRDTKLLYQPHLIKREAGELAVVFRDRNLSDMIGFSYHHWNTKDAVEDFMKHLENTAAAFKNTDILVTIAMDGENAWEYYKNDGHDFLELLYTKLSESDNIQTTTVKEYLNKFPAKKQIKRLAAGSWIYSEFGKWIGNAAKARAWEYLAIARKELQDMQDRGEKIPDLAWKQMYIAEGSDWFWWYGEGPEAFDELFRRHLSNFYKLIGKQPPDYLKTPITC